MKSDIRSSQGYEERENASFRQYSCNQVSLYFAVRSTGIMDSGGRSVRATAFKSDRPREREKSILWVLPVAPVPPVWGGLQYFPALWISRTPQVVPPSQVPVV
jgi:hypothetical protein